MNSRGIQLETKSNVWISLPWLTFMFQYLPSARSVWFSVWSANVPPRAFKKVKIVPSGRYSRSYRDFWTTLVDCSGRSNGKCLIGFDLEVQNTYSTIVWKLREHSKKLNPNYSNPGVTQSNHLESPVFLVQSRKPKNIKWPLPSNRRTDQRTERPSCPQGSAVIRCKGQLPNAVPRHTIRLTPRISCACGHLVRDGWWKIINCIPQRDVVTKSINHPANGQQTLNPRPASRPRS